MNSLSIGKMNSILYRFTQNYLNIELSKYGISSGQVPFLAELFQKDGISQKFLRKLLFYDKGTVARALQKLEKKNYIIRRRSLKDNRIKIIFLTEQAYRIKKDFLKILSFWNDNLIWELNDDDKKICNNIFQSIMRNVFKLVKKQSNVKDKY